MLHALLPTDFPNMLEQIVHQCDFHFDLLGRSYVSNGQNFAHFWPQIFWKRVPKFWDLDYKTEHTSNHVAEFHSDRPRDLGDLAVKKASGLMFHC